MSDDHDLLLFTHNHTHNNGFSLIKVNEEFLALAFFNRKGGRKKKSIDVPSTYRIELKPSHMMKDIKLEKRKENNEMYNLFVIPRESEACNIYYKAGTYEEKLLVEIEVHNFFETLND
ncbi:7013_t:CDS:1 [Dentiscutata heterogama]|uniref:7013_t:CDS:1 n=1 Tax=Dentiscutata heterogama TaxID=1316150 RepID=A0ACA9K9J2_9GLOM|nr:7013_t:CDS:1 [Dentiscutata heterogama]